MATLCVKPSSSGSGDGSDWTNALGWGFTAVRGNTYYLADGTYTSKTFSVAVSGATLITIKKATVADHGTSTGWSDTMGDGVAVTENIGFTTSYWVLDGVVGGWDGTWGSWDTGHGIAIEVFADTAGLMVLTGTVTDITIKHVRFLSDRTALVGAGIKGTTGSCARINVSYCSMVNLFGVNFHIGSWSDCLIERNYFYANKSTAESHTESISSIGTNDDIIIRWNYYEKIEGTAVFAGVNTGVSNDWLIYGNVFFDCQTSILYYYGVSPPSSDQELNGCLFYNNTIVDCGPGVSSGYCQTLTGTGNFLRNNLLYNNAANTFASVGFNNDYDYASLNHGSDSPGTDMDANVLQSSSNGQNGGSTDPFVDYDGTTFLNGDWHATTDAGTSTTATLPGNDVDMFGVSRVGLWTRGALENGEGGGGGGNPSIVVTGRVGITGRGAMT